MLPYILRERTEEDTNFIYNSWLKNYKAHSSCQYTVDKIYFKYQQEIIDFLFNTANTLILCFPEEPTEIMGYLCYQFNRGTMIIHYAYLKSNYRHHKLMSTVVQSLDDPNNTLIVATHAPYYFNTLKETIPNKHIIFDPFFITTQRLLHK